MYSELISIIVNLLIAMLIPTAVVLGLTYINRNSKELLVRKYGFSSQIWLGCVGIFIHECSHAVMALIFGHNIVEFKPLILPRNVARNDGALGYVRQTWNANSTYQNMGNLFIGTAPIWGCTLAIYWLLKIMTAFVLLMSLSLVLSVAINLVLRFLNFFI